MDKYHQAIEQSAVKADTAGVREAVDRILSEHLMENTTDEVYKTIFSCIDLTTLKTTDSTESVAKMTERVNDFEEQYPQYPSVAAVCVYPNFVQMVRGVLEVSSVRIAAVSGGFPSGQTFTEVKVAETALAGAAGADEVDMVFNVGNYIDGNYEEVCDEIAEMKHSCRGGKLKVILETGALKSLDDIKSVSVLSLYAGADFLKTSTGKEYAGASLEATYVMAQCIKEYNEKNNIKVGLKVAGGIRTAADALKYYTIVKEVLGPEWLTPELFRIGASSLANSILTALEGKETSFF